MRANVNLLTSASQANNELSVQGHENAVAAHVAGDGSLARHHRQRALFHRIPAVAGPALRRVGPAASRQPDDEIRNARSDPGIAGTARAGCLSVG